MSPTKSSVEVVGVVRDTWPDGAFEAPKPALFVPLRSFYDAFPWQPATFLVVRGVAVARAVEAGVERVAPGTPVYDIAPIADRLFPTVASREDLGRALLILGSIAALLAIVGVNALLGRILAERTSEFGLRLALGSTRRGIVGLVLRNVALLLGVALVLGGLGAIAALGSIRHLLIGVDGIGLLPFSVAGAVLLVPIIGMALWSGLRATRVDLTSALRCE